MAFILKNIFPHVSRNSNAARSAAEFANALAVYSMSRALTAAGAEIGTTTTKVQTANTITYTVGGKFYSKTATDDLWAPGADSNSSTVVGKSSWQKYICLLDTSGNASVWEGTQSKVSAAAVTWDNISKVSAWAPFLTAVGSTKCIAVTLTVATDSSHTFTPGTTAFGATGITTTYTDGIDQSILPLIADQKGSVVGNGG